MPENESLDNASGGKKINWELILKIAGALVAVGGLAFGIYQYSGQSRKDKDIMLQKQRFELYFKITEVTSKFAQSSDPKESEQLRKQFWEISYGQLGIVEDETVIKAMKKFGKAVQGWERINEPPSDFNSPSDFVFYPPGEGSGYTFEQLSYELSQAVKASLGD